MKKCLCVLALLVSACVQNPATKEYDITLMNEDDEYALGRKVRQDIPNYQINKDLELQKYLSAMANEVYQSGERAENDFTFYLINDDTPNAFATPGYMFFNTGFLPYLPDEGSLYGILGHEAAHINARHTVQKISNDFLIRWFLNSVQAGSGMLTKSNASYAHLLATRSYSRDKETEADRFAIKYLNKLGIPSANTALAFKALDKQTDLLIKRKNLSKEPDNRAIITPSFLSTHPLSEDRVRNIENITVSSSDYLSFYNQDKYYQMIDGIVYGYGSSSRKNKNIDAIDNSEYYITKNNKIMRSPKSGVYGFKNTAYFKNYGLKLQMPDDYQARVKSYDPVGYNYADSIEVSVLEISDDKNRTVLDVFADSVNLDESQKQDLKQKVKDSKTNFNDDYFTINKSLTHQEEIFSFINSDNFFTRLFNLNNMYYYIYIKHIDKLDENAEHDGLMNTYRLVILSTNSKKSFDEHMLNDILFIKDNLVELSNQEKAKIKPLTIKTTKLDKTKSIEQLAKENIPYIHFEQEWFKLINGIYDDYADVIEQGQWIKLIVNNNKNI